MPPPHGGRAASLSAGRAVLLGLLKLCWGFNWPMMKVGVAEVPPLTFRAASLLLGVPVLGCALALLKVPFAVPHRHWPELLLLAPDEHADLARLPHHCGEGAAKRTRGDPRLYHAGLFGGDRGAAVPRRLDRPGMARRRGGGAGRPAAAVARTHGSRGQPSRRAIVLPAAATWALGTQRLRRTRICLPTLTLTFWMTLLTSIAVLVLVLALSLERPPLHTPPASAWFALVYNAVLIFGFAHAAWFELARSLPPVASTLSVMLIPVLGVFSGAFLLGEVLYWQDGAAVALMVLAIAAVLWPRSEA